MHIKLIQFAADAGQSASGLFVLPPFTDETVLTKKFYPFGMSAPAGSVIHFFCDDERYEKLLLYSPDRFLASCKTNGYLAVMPDFSMWDDVPASVNFSQLLKATLVGSWLAANGVSVIPSVSFSKNVIDFSYLTGGLVLFHQLRRGDNARTYQSGAEKLPSCCRSISFGETGEIKNEFIVEMNRRTG
ncbi:hypothetical protein FACS189454_04290 [Planctomycetales bacterium]|nr:hypothetical protein FACS189454_04290 [Planctomycetales bacterium]